MNINLPPLAVYVRNSFILDESDEKYNSLTKGRLIGARALQNQAIQFQVLLDTGALFTGLPANSIVFKKDAPKRELIDCQMWDAISSQIEFIQFDMLLYMPCTLKLKSGDIIKGEYLFTIDHVGNSDLSRDPAEWKMFHVIKSEEGGMHLYPQYRIKFLDDALCLDSEDNFPKYKFNETIWRLGS